MSYVMESQKEFDRLEKQSSKEAYDFKAELSQIEFPKQAQILDAGCGSGIVTRYLASTFPNSFVVGCDAGVDRISQATVSAAQFTNLKFQVERLDALSFDTGVFDVIICRFVIEHILKEKQLAVLNELRRCLKPGGKIVLIDIDGGFFNLYPLNETVETGLNKINTSPQIDLMIGRKLPHLLETALFDQVEYRIETHSFTGDLLKVEKELVRERFENAMGFLENLMGGKEDATRFVDAYLRSLDRAGTVLFYNKFIVSAVKPTSRHNLKLIDESHPK